MRENGRMGGSRSYQKLRRFLVKLILSGSRPLKINVNFEPGNSKVQ
jgi:hypothetical protein